MPTIIAKPKFVGMNSHADASDLTAQEASSALNVNLNKGTIKKRDGYTQVHKEATGEGGVLGIFGWQRDSASAERKTQILAKIGGYLWKKDITAESWTNLGAHFTANRLADFAVYKDRCYIVDMDTFKVTDGTTVSHPTLGAPVVAAQTVNTESIDVKDDEPTPTLAGGGVAGGPLNGEYDYKITYYSSTWQMESPSTAWQTPVDSDGNSEGGTAVRNRSLRLIDVPRSTDERVDFVRIYRRNLTRGEVDWYLVGTLPNYPKGHDGGTASGSTTEAVRQGAGGTQEADFIDDVHDDDVSLLDRAPLSVALTFPDFRYIENHRGVMFLAGDTDDLYYSLPDKPLSITKSLTLGGDSEQGRITGLVSWRGLLYVFKDDSIWALDGLTDQTFTAQPLVRGVGCVGGHSIVATDNVLYFMGEDGFYAFNGTSAELISRAVSPEVLARNRQRDKFVFGVDDKDRQAIIWAFATGTSTQNDSTLVFFYGNSKDVGGASWCPWTFYNASSTAVSLVSAATVTTNDVTGEKNLYYGFFDDVIGEAGGNADAGTGSIIFKWRTGKIDGGAPLRNKAWATAFVEQTKQDNYSDLELRYYRNADTEYELADTIDPQEPTDYVRLRERSRDLRLEFYQKDVEPVEIITMGIEASLAGRVV